MSTTSIVLLIIGLAVFIQSLIILSFPKCSIKCCKKCGCRKLCKNEKALKKIGTWGLVIAIALILIAINI